MIVAVTSAEKQLTKIEEASSSVASSTKSCEAASVRKVSEVKGQGSSSVVGRAWYDVGPSDDENEAPEADSLASIISHRASSDEEGVYQC